jgi:flavodoxin
MSAFRIIYVIAAVLISINFSLVAEDNEKDKNLKVLLVYSSGDPFKEKSEIKSPDELDAISSPTPKIMNIHKAALRIRENLEAQGMAVRFAKVDEMNDWREILNYEIVVIGSATRFWNMTWECKRFFDELFYRINRYPGKASGISFAFFTSTEIVPSGERALAAMKSVITDCQGTVAEPKMILLDKWPLIKAQEEIDKFSQELADLIMQKPEK